MNLKTALLAGAVLAAPALAMADPVTGLYIGAGAGVNLGQNQTIKGLSLPDGTVAGAHTNPKFDVGWAGVGSVGYGFGNGLRVEIEGDYRRNDVRSVGGLGSAKGYQEQYGAMANVLYDVDLTAYGVDFMQPYVGLGAGWMQNSWKHVSAGTPEATVLVGTSANGLAVQGIVGAAVPLSMIDPGLAMTVEYRLMDMPEDRKYDAELVTPAGVAGGRLKVSDDFNHSVMLGLRYAFETAPPPPPPAPPAPVAAPAPAPSRTYLVFFDWDKADLTERARQIIAQAAQNSTRVQYTRIEVGGNADRTGTEQYNMALSLRRANTVAAELVKDGVAQSVIDVKAYGDTRPLVSTAAGVREPQNRRVEIVLH